MMIISPARRMFFFFSFEPITPLEYLNTLCDIPDSSPNPLLGISSELLWGGYMDNFWNHCKEFIKFVISEKFQESMYT